MFKKKRIQIGALLLSAAIILSATACGTSDNGGENPNTSTKNEQTQKDNVNPEWVYVPEYIDLDDMQFDFQTKIIGNYLYYLENEWNDETNETTISVMRINVLDQTKETVSSFTGASGGGNYAVDREGNFYNVAYIWSDVPMNDSASQKLIKYTKDGTEAYSLDLDAIMSRESMDYINDILCDEKGRIYLHGENKVLLIDADGKYVGAVSVAGSNDWISGYTIGDDGKAYYQYYSYSTGSGQQKMSSVDFDQKAVAATYSGVCSDNSLLCPAGNGTFYMGDSNTLYEYDLATQTATELFQWIDSDINGSNVQKISLLPDGRILAFIYDWDSGTSEIVALKKTPGSEVTTKQVITIGTLYQSSDLNRAAVKFNKSNDKYRIKIKSYVNSNVEWNENTYTDAITAMMNSITSADCPDILDTSSLDVAHLASKGLFEDMGTYLDQSTVLSREDYLQNVLDAYTIDGKLVGIPKTISVQTLVGSATDFGNKTGWTLDEMIDYAKQNSGKQLIELDKLSVVYMLMINNQDSFINWKTGECNFNSPEFIKILEFANTFSDEVTYNEDGPSTPTKIQNGSLLMAQVYISSFTDIQQYDAFYNNQAAYIGFPTVDGSAGHMMTADTVYAITSSSTNKEGAWSFIESILSDTEGDRWSWGFSTNKNKLKKDMAEATKIEYLTDENGEYFLDENGEPIMMNGGGMLSYEDNWSYTEHVATQDEVDRTVEILEQGKLITSQNTQIMNIISEESDPYFKGQKSASDVAAVIQSRVQIYVDENF